ncbi:beta-microseminoprotein [Rattus rattus]|uniref:beta-microseminoprotein n=1 Tax=Rattus rattus TaxID=10117 RepID=UPI0013F38F02|nr:beta-microseminoprotein [Rattus rattus]
MKARLGSLLVLATLVTASNAACSIQRLKRLPNEKSDECTDIDGGKHVLNTYWQKNCEWCFCDKTAITCCTKTLIPVSYDKKRCQRQFHSENCTYSVVERTNPGKTCPVNGWTI